MIFKSQNEVLSKLTLRSNIVRFQFNMFGYPILVRRSVAKVFTPPREG